MRKGERRERGREKREIERGKKGGRESVRKGREKVGKEKNTKFCQRKANPGHACGMRCKRRQQLAEKVPSSFFALTFTHSRLSRRCPQASSKVAPTLRNRKDRLICH